MRVTHYFQLKQGISEFKLYVIRLLSLNLFCDFMNRVICPTHLDTLEVKVRTFLYHRGPEIQSTVDCLILIE